MKVDRFVKEGLLKIRVVPNSSREELVGEMREGDTGAEGLRLYLKARPEKGKANLAVVKFFKKELGLKVEIVSGLKGREKVLRVLEWESRAKF